MRSMTGFGVGEAPLDGGRLVLETRSVNHRFLEVRVNLPPELTTHGFQLEQLVRQRFRRGRFELSARLLGPVFAPPELDEQRARTAFAALRLLRDEVAPGAELPLSLLAAVPELFRAPAGPARQAAQEALRQALEASLAALDAMREREGEALVRDIRAHLGTARATCRALAERSGSVVGSQRDRLRERVARLLNGSEIEPDPGRLELEVALLADRSDISEELARLASHFEQLDNLLTAVGQVGRTMDFLLQEMAREANTVASKSPDATLTQQAVALKAAVERMREQVQNVE